MATKPTTINERYNKTQILDRIAATTVVKVRPLKKLKDMLV